MNDIDDTDPSILYRYRPIRGTADDETYLKPIFVKHELYFPSRLELNDPFECIVPDFSGVPAWKLREFIKKHAERATVGLQRWQRRKTIGRLMEPKSLARTRSDLQENVDRLRILSLSKRNDDLLMWSHYSNGHRGVCLGFAASKTDVFFGRALPVQYSASRPVFDPEDDNFKASEKVVLTKSEHWTYEGELRILEPNGKRIYTFPPGDLRTMIFGSHVSDSDRTRLLEWMRAGNLTPELYEAKEDPTDFKLQICPV